MAQSSHRVIVAIDNQKLNSGGQFFSQAGSVAFYIQYGKLGGVNPTGCGSLFLV
jgi:hypothetical protein